MTLTLVAAPRFFFTVAVNISAEIEEPFLIFAIIKCPDDHSAGKFNRASRAKAISDHVGHLVYSLT